MTGSQMNTREEDTEPGQSPKNGARHGVWKILTVSLVLALLAMSAVGLIYL